MKRVIAIKWFFVCLVSCFVSSVFAGGASPWTGFYLGGNAGIGMGTTDWSNIVVPVDTNQNSAGTFASYNQIGMEGGIQGGYNHQFGSMVVGVEGQIDVAGINGNTQCFGGYGDQSAFCTSRIKSLNEISVHLGYAFDNKWLVFVKDGMAFNTTEFTPKMPWSYNSNYGYLKTTQTRVGYVLGVGVDYFVSDNVAIGFSYSKLDFRKRSVTFNPENNDNNYTPIFMADILQQLDSIAWNVDYKF